MRLQDLIVAWQSFWFKEQSPLACCVFRIVFGMVFLTQVLTQYWIDFKLFFGEHPVIPYNDYVAYWWRTDCYINVFEFLPVDDRWHAALLVATAVFTVMMIIGFCTRLSTIVVAFIYVSLCHQYPFLCNAGDNMQRLSLILLCFSRAGDGLSVDAYLKNRKGDWRKAVFNPPAVSPWAQRMIQVQIALAYISTALLKINSPIWFFGNGCYFATRLTDFAKLRIPIILDQPIILYSMGWFTILVEFAAGILIWIKEFRYWIILLGVILHIGIDWTLNIPIFEFAFMSAYILFIDPEDLKKLGCCLRIFSKYFYKGKPMHQVN